MSFLIATNFIIFKSILELMKANLRPTDVTVCLAYAQIFAKIQARYPYAYKRYGYKNMYRHIRTPPQVWKFIDQLQPKRNTFLTTVILQKILEYRYLLNFTNQRNSPFFPAANRRYHLQHLFHLLCVLVRYNA